MNKSPSERTNEVMLKVPSRSRTLWTLGRFYKMQVLFSVLCKSVSQIVALERSRKLRVLLNFSCLFSPENWILKHYLINKL